MVEQAAHAGPDLVPERKPERSRMARRVNRLFILTSLLILLSAGVSGFLTLGVCQRYLLPELAAKAHIVGAVVAARIDKALSYAIPFDRFVAMDDYLEGILRTQPDISYLAVTDPAGHVLYHAGLTGEAIVQLLAGDQAEAAAATSDASGVIGWLSRTSLRVVGRPDMESVTRLGNFFDTTMPIAHGGMWQGVLHVGVSTSVYADEIRAQALDIGMLALAATLITVEILLAVVTTTLTGPLQVLVQTLWAASQGALVAVQRGGGGSEIGRLAARVDAILAELRRSFARVMEKAERVRAGAAEQQTRALAASVASNVLAVIRPQGTLAVDAAQAGVAFIASRLCAFTFVLAEEMARPFLPVYIQDMADRSGIANAGLAVGLPLSTFMLTVALAMPLLGPLCGRLGGRRLFILGAGLSTLGMLGMALTGQYWVLVGCRLVSGVGYAMTFTACQDHVLAHAGPSNRAVGMATFVGGITAADIAGPAIGGLIAGRIGLAAALFCAASLAFLAGVAALLTLKQVAADDRPPRGLRLADMAHVAANGRMLALLLLSAVPAKLLLSGALFFLTPLIAQDLGATQPEIGRIVMAYGVAGLVLSPFLARLVDRWDGHGAAVCIGGIVAGAGMIPMFFEPSLDKLIIAVVALGAGQALSIPPQFVLGLRVCEAEVAKYGQAPVVGLYRLIERLGGAAGPSLAGLLAVRYGQPEAMAILGLGVTAAAVLLAVTLMFTGLSADPDDWADIADAPAGIEGLQA